MAEYWLIAAEKSKDDGGYKLAVYALEMSLETALKAVLLSFRVEPPKTHNIVAFMRESVRNGGETMPKRFVSELDPMLSTFQLLLDNRNTAGYSFSTGSETPFLKRIAEESLPKAKRYLGLCKDLVSKPP